MHVSGNIFGYIPGILGDYIFIKLAFQGIKTIRQIPEDVPKRAHAEGLVACLLAVVGSTYLFLYPLSRLWFVFMIVDLFGLGCWGWLDFTMLDKLEHLKHQGRLSEANWFHRTFYRGYLRKISSEAHEH